MTGTLRPALGIVSLALALVAFGCKSTHEQGVESNLHTQWTTVKANVQQTTDAARSVFESEGLKNIKANATNVDGEVTGQKADGTKITASVKKLSEVTSQVSVNVGTLGDPKLGASLAKQTQERAETTK